MSDLEQSHQATVDKLTAERDEAQARVKRLQAYIVYLEGAIDSITSLVTVLRSQDGGLEPGDRE